MFINTFAKMSVVTAVALTAAGSAQAGMAGYFDSFSTTWLPSGAQSGTLAGTVDMQNGWTTRDAFTSATSVGKWDQRVQEVSDANGTRNVFRMSNAITSSNYSAQVSSATAGQVAGETNSALWNDRGTNGSSPTAPQYGAYAATNTFYNKLSFRSATGAAQTNLSVVLSASAKQSTVRMSWMQIQDNGSTGFNLNVYDINPDGTFPGAATMIASGLSYSDLHTIETGITFNDGFNNDVMNIWLNGALIHTGSTWENYYRFNELITPGTPRLQAVDSMLFRVAGTAATGTSLNGFYFEDFAISNNIVPAPGAIALLGLAGLVARRRRN